ncbi:hypothetical protein Tco_1506777 [Tanacetum coccineum]
MATMIANLKPGDGKEPLEIRVIRKWISYGKRGECCFIFIGQNGDAIQTVATLSDWSYFDFLFKVGSCYRLANYICESGKIFMITASHNTCIRLGRAAKFQEIPDDEGSDKDYELNLSMYGKAAKIKKLMNAKLVWLKEKYNYRSQTYIGGSSSQTHEIGDVFLTEKELHQLHLDEEALREILEEQAMDEKAREDKIRQKQADDEFFLEFRVVRYDSDYESSD